jgi:hypothetical protein
MPGLGDQPVAHPVADLLEEDLVVSGGGGYLELDVPASNKRERPRTHGTREIQAPSSMS